MTALQEFFINHPNLVVLLCAELICVLVKRNEIEIVTKKRSQRTKDEQNKINRGLLRSLLLEMFVFVPVSVTLVLFASPLLMRSIPAKLKLETDGMSMNALLGVLSYGFPFAFLRNLMTRIALKTLQEFASLANKKSGDEDKEDS